MLVGLSAFIVGVCITVLVDELRMIIISKRNERFNRTMNELGKACDKFMEEK